MTDAAISVTQSVVERFTDQYLRSLGCSIEKHDDRWDVVVPDEVDTELATGNITLVCGDEETSDKDNEEPLHPDSQFFQQILTEASKQAPTGKISIDTERAEIQIPGWIQEGNIEVSETGFTPYYDRTALVTLFQVGIETVSEYQSELLRAIAVDMRTEESLPKLEKTFLRLTSMADDAVESTQSDLEKAGVQPLLATAREQLVDRIQATVNEIHQEASRAADAEVEEYRQMQQQRLQEIEETHSNLSSKIDELGKSISSSEQTERVQALKKRKQLKSEYDEIDTELTNLRNRRDHGFPERQQEIRERHALDVRVTPLTVTQVEYERGEIELELIEGEISRTITIGYGSGVGVTEEIQCSSCNQVFTRQNPVQSIKDGFRCTVCTSDNVL